MAETVSLNGYEPSMVDDERKAEGVGGAQAIDK